MLNESEKLIIMNDGYDLDLVRVIPGKFLGKEHVLHHCT